MHAALDPFGDHPFTTEQARIVQRLVERVDVLDDALQVRIRAEGLASFMGELRQQAKGKRYDAGHRDETGPRNARRADPDTFPAPGCQTACNIDPLSALNFDPQVGCPGSA